MGHESPSGDVGSVHELLGIVGGRRSRKFVAGKVQWESQPYATII